MYYIVFKFNSVMCKVCFFFFYYIIIFVQFKFCVFFFRQISKVERVQVGSVARYLDLRLIGN